MAPAFLYPVLTGLKTASVLKTTAFSFSSLAAAATSFHADIHGGDGDFIGQTDPHSLEDHDHGGHEAHGDHGHDENHGEEYEDHAAHEEHAEEDHGEHEDHEELDHEQDHEHDDMDEHEHGEHEDGEMHEEEMEGYHADEAAELKVAPGVSVPEGQAKAKGSKESKAAKEAEGKPAEGVAPAIAKVVKNVAVAAIMVSATSRLVEARTKELGLAPWGALAAACVRQPPGVPPRSSTVDRSSKDYIPAPVRHVGFAF